MKSAHISGEHEDVVLFGGGDGIDDQAPEAASSTCYCDSDHDFKNCIAAIEREKSLIDVNEEKKAIYCCPTALGLAIPFI